MIPSLSKLTNTLIWATFMTCFDMLWDVFIYQEAISADTSGVKFVITALVYYFWAHGFFTRHIEKRRATKD